MTSPGDDLRRIADLLDAAGMHWHARGLPRYIAGDVLDLETAWGLRPQPGEESWRTVDRRDRRDEILRAIYVRFYAPMPYRPAAVAIVRSADVYASARWPVDRLLAEPPAEYRGTQRELLFALMATGASLPSVERVRRIVVMSSGYSCPTDGEKVAS